MEGGEEWACGGGVSNPERGGGGERAVEEEVRLARIHLHLLRLPHSR